MAKNKKTTVSEAPVDLRFINSTVEAQSELPENTAAPSGPSPYGASETHDVVELEADYKNSCPKLRETE